MRATENYELNLLDAEDFVNREVLNENTEKIDEVLKNLEEPEHDTAAQTKVEELTSGESLKVALRKLAKAVADYISHKADKVAHITAEERTAWNAKLGTEKIAANLTTDTDGMVLAAAMGKNLQEQISTLNSNLSKVGTYYGATSYIMKNAASKAYGSSTFTTAFMILSMFDTDDKYFIGLVKYVNDTSYKTLAVLHASDGVSVASSSTANIQGTYRPVGLGTLAGASATVLSVS